MPGCEAVSGSHFFPRKFQALENYPCLGAIAPANVLCLPPAVFAATDASSHLQPVHMASPSWWSQLHVWVATCMHMYEHKLPLGRCALSTLSSQPLWPTEIVILPTSQNNKSTYFPTKRHSQPPLQPYEAIYGCSSRYNAIQKCHFQELLYRGANMAFSLLELG